MKPKTTMVEKKKKQSEVIDTQVGILDWMGEDVEEEEEKKEEGKEEKENKQRIDDEEVNNEAKDK